MIKPTNTNRRRWYVYAVFLGILLHLIVAVGVTLYIQKQSPDGILKNSDETAYITYGHKVSQNWKTDIRSGYSDLGRGDPHTGYYYIIAALDYVGVSNPVILRIINVAVGLIGIGLWGLAIRIGEKAGRVSRTQLLLTLFTPSLMFMSSLILKETWLYMLTGAMAILAALVMEEKSSIRKKIGLIACIALLLFLMTMFRGYETLLIGGIFFVCMAVKMSWQYSLLLIAGIVACLVIIQPYALFYYLRILLNVDVAAHGWQALLHADWSNPLKFLQIFYEGNSTGGSAIPLDTHWFAKVWLFLSFPLPWQATSVFQKIVVPEVVVTLLLLPLALHGMWLKCAQKHTFGIFLLAWLVVMSLFYIVLSANLGTLFRHKITLMFIYNYFVAVGFASVFQNKAGFEEDYSNKKDIT